MTGRGLTLHYHEGTHRNIPVRACGFFHQRASMQTLQSYGDEC